ncbi:AAA family ATPase [Limnohabitans sp. WS1]|nr:AAA family ATPase [Limnohabitans sp. WS1]
MEPGASADAWPDALPSGESETVEFKTSLAELKQGLISLVAMLNKHGQADLWFGIAPSGKPTGLMANEKTLRDVSQALGAHIDPRLYPEITSVDVAGKTCLRVQATGHQKPYFAHGRAYIRVADEDRQMSARELESLILKRNSAALRWDNEPCTTPLAELSEDKIRHFVERAGLPWDNPTNALTKLGLLPGGQLLNAARLFFAHQPIQLRCALFASTTSATILDRHDFDGDVLELIEEAEKYILKHIHIGMRLEGMRRVDVPEISRAALREAIINAFCHRDWRDPDYIQIAVYKNRVEIRNPGGLFDGLTFEQMRRGNVSHRRNPLLADLFRRIDMVEAWGRGMPLILQNAPDVEFREIARLFVASFERPSAAAVNTPKTEATAPKTGLEPPENAKETPKKHTRNTKELVLKALQAQPDITAKALALALKLSEASVRHHLRVLQAAQRIRHVGPTKGGHWEVLDA